MNNNKEKCHEFGLEKHTIENHLHTLKKSDHYMKRK